MPLGNLPYRSFQASQKLSPLSQGGFGFGNSFDKSTASRPDHSQAEETDNGLIKKSFIVEESIHERNNTIDDMVFSGRFQAYQHQQSKVYEDHEPDDLRRR